MLVVARDMPAVPFKVARSALSSETLVGVTVPVVKPFTVST